MIVIEFVHEYDEKSEKPHKPQSIGAYVPQPGAVGPIYHLAHERQQTLIQAAHAAHLARQVRQEKANGSSAGCQVPVDVQRYAEIKPASGSIVERYARRIRGLIVRG